MEFFEVIKDRYSCKSFSDKKIDKEVMDKILEAARLAPTAKNLQEHHIYVVESEEMLSKIDEVTPCRYNAPVVLVVTYNVNNVFVYPGNKRDSGIEDATIVATHLMLASKALDADSCWINFFNPEEVKEKLGLPEDEEVLMMLDLGYPAADAKPLANHNSRKELKETVSYL